MTGALLDTSILIALADDGLDLKQDAAISVVTIGELEAGVELAKTGRQRSVRQARLRAVRESFIPIEVDETVAVEYGRLLAVARKSGRVQKATDLFIAATAAVTGRTLLTRDDSQGALADQAGIAVRVL